MTKELTIEEGNRLIAEFMGYLLVEYNQPIGIVWERKDEGMKRRSPSPSGQSVDSTLSYHSSWDWLMPTVEKIEAIYDEFHGYFGVYINSNSCTIQGTKLNTSKTNPHYAYYNEVTVETKIGSAWLAIIQFIQWYNEQSTKIEKEEQP